jgi:hypothetical protein
MRLRAIATQREAAVYGNRLSGDVIVRLEKKTHGSRDVFRPPETKHGAARNLPVVFPGLHASGGHADGGGSRRNDVHAHMIPLLRGGARGVD